MVKLEFPYIIIYSKSICNIWSKVIRTRSGSPVMGFAAFPNIIVMRNADHPMTKYWINHEKIHHRQQWESLYQCSIIGYLEYYYARFILKKGKLEAYFYKAMEQEAFDNQHDLEYLNNRKIWAIMKYYKHKPVIGRDSKYQILRK